VRLRLALLCLIAVAGIAPVASALAQAPIDDYAYDPAKTCRKHPTPGALALVDWLEKDAKGTSWGIMRCERWGKNSASLHSEGRAVDWHLDASRPADRREARRLIDMWLATTSPATSTPSRGAWASRRSFGTAARGGQARRGWATTRRASRRAESDGSA
jgi:hypothetical protein